MLTVEIVNSVTRITVSRRRYVNGGDCVLCNPMTVSRRRYVNGGDCVLCNPNNSK